MKKIFKTLSAAGTISAALVLGSCDNTAENQKLMAEDMTKAQTAADEQLAGLQAEADADCAATVDSIATVRYNEWLATSAPKAVKAKAKPKPVPSPTAKKEEEKTNPKADRFNNPEGGKTVTQEQTESKKDRFEDTSGRKKVTIEDTKKKGDRFKDPK